MSPLVKILSKVYECYMNDRNYIKGGKLSIKIFNIRMLYFFKSKEVCCQDWM